LIVIYYRLDQGDHKKRRIEMMEQRVEVQERRLDDPQPPPCAHCYSTGWCQMTALNDWDEEETYMVLCNKCSKRRGA